MRLHLDQVRLQQVTAVEVYMQNVELSQAPYLEARLLI